MSRAALVIAHPGHELCLYGWLETSRPLVFVLTNGSGRTGVSRLDSTTKVLADTGARNGSIYGRFTDLELYKAILNRDFLLFEQLTSELAEALVANGIEEVTGEAIEGYNPVHDVCRLIINAAVKLALRTSERSIINREFLLFAHRYADLEALHPDDFVQILDDARLARKLAAAQAYPELESEVDAMLNKKVIPPLREFPDLGEHFSNLVTRTMGKETYRVECMRLARASGLLYGTSAEVPFYEYYGKKLVAAGVYESAITCHEHIAPLAKALSSFAEGAFK